MVTAAGSGYSRWNDLAVTRWREDATRDDTGSYLPAARHRQRPRLVGGLSALRRRSPTSYEVSFTEDRAEIIRSDGDLIDHARSAGVARGRRRGAAAVDQQRLAARARDRSDLVCGAGARRRRPPTSRIRRSRRCSCAPSSSRARARCSPTAGAARPTNRRSGPRITPWSRAVTVGEPGIRNRPRALHRPRPRAARAARHARGPRAVGHRRARCSTRCSRCATACASRPAARRASRSGPASRQPRAACSSSLDKHRDTECAHARRHAGLDAGAGAAAAPRHRRLAGQPVPAARRTHPVRRRRARARPSDTIRRGAAARTGCGRRASPATCPSCCCASRTSKISPSRASCCRRTSTGASSGCRWTS